MAAKSLASPDSKTFGESLSPVELNQVAPPWGGPLAESDYRTLEASWITRALADAANLRRVDHLTGQEILGQKGKRDCAGIVFSYYWPGDPNLIAY
jgi:hypothetical protein